jgi:predicted GNAT family acetyltransferase
MHDASSESWATAEAGMDAAWAEARDDHAMFSYLADDGGDPIAMAQLVWLTVGLAYLGGATTLPGARGRGAFRALVRARWDEVVAAGKPVLLVQAGRMSAPILEGLGFETVVPTRVLIDSSSRA